MHPVKIFPNQSFVRAKGRIRHFVTDQVLKILDSRFRQAIEPIIQTVVSG